MAEGESGFRIASAYVEVTPDTSGFREKLQADLDAATAGMQAEVKVGLNDEDLNAKLDEARGRLDEFDGSEAEAHLGLADDDFHAKADEAEARLESLDGAEASPKLGLDDSEFRSKLSEDQAALAAANSDTGEGSLIGAITMGVGTMLPGIAPAVAGLGLLGGTGLAAFGGIGKALSAHSQATTQTAENAAQTANQVESAQLGLAETMRNAAASQIQATQAVTQAEQQLGDAEFNEKQAQVNLTNARIQARLTLQQLNDAQKDSVISVKAAQLALEQAEYQQQLTDQNAMSTQLDREQAALAVAQAQRQVIEAKQNETNATAAANRANKLGINGDQNVVQAKHAVLDATNAVKDAQMQAADAQRNLAITAANNADQIKQAQLAVAQAQRQGAASMNQYAYEMGKLTAPARAVVRELLGMHGAVRKIEGIAQQTVLPGIVTFLRGVKGILPEVDLGVRLMGQAMSKSFGGFGKLMQTSAFKDGLGGLLRNGVQFVNIVLPAFAQFLQMLGKIGGQQGAGSGLANLLAGIAHGLTGLAGSLGRYIGPINQFLTAAGHIIAAIGPPLGVMIGLVAKALGPLDRYLNSHPNGTIVKVIGGIVAGLIAVKGLQKILPSFVTGPLEKAVGKAGSWGAGIAKNMSASIVGGLKGVGTKIGSVLSSGFETVQLKSMYVWDAISGFGSKVASMMSSAASAVGSFVSTYATKLAEAATATGAWIAEHAVATASFIAENVAQAASATAAFIAENLATLGLVAGIAALVAAVIWMGTHWQDVWGAIKTVALDLWHNVLDPMWQGIEKGAKWLYTHGIKPYFESIKLEFQLLEDAALWLWHNVFDPVWQGILSGVRGFESAFGSAWTRVEGIFKTPVNFLIGTVYDNGIKRFWNDIVGHIGLGSLKLPEIPKLAHGGIVPGRDTGHDNQLVAMRSGEGVLVPEAVRAIGPGTVHALNNRFGSGGSSSGDGSRGFKKGGILGDIGDFFTSVGHSILSGTEFAAQFAKNPIKAVTSLLDRAVHTTAGGDLGKIMTAIPKTLIGDLASLVTKRGSGPGSGTSSPVHASGTVASWFKEAVKLTGVPVSWIPDLETIGWYESSDNPNAINLSDSNAAAGDPSRGIMQTIMTTFDEYHMPGTSNDIYNPIANIAAAIRYIRSRYGNPADTPGIESLAHGGPYQGYDSGGWLMPGGMPINQTGRPEAVLTPEESAAFIAIAKRFSGDGGGEGSGGMLGGVNFNYFGTQYPTVEVRAQQKRDLALALSGAN